MLMVIKHQFWPSTLHQKSERIINTIVVCCFQIDMVPLVLGDTCLCRKNMQKHQRPSTRGKWDKEGPPGTTWSNVGWWSKAEMKHYHAWIFGPTIPTSVLKWIRGLYTEAPGFKDKTRYTPYVSPGSQISHIVTNKGNNIRQYLLHSVLV